MVYTLHQLLSNELPNELDKDWELLCRHLFDTLCRSLQQERWPRQFWGSVQDLGDRWLSYINGGLWPWEADRDVARLQHKVVHDLLICAQYADANRDELNTGIERAFGALGKYEGLVAELQYPPKAVAHDWAWGCMRSLLGQRASHKTKVAIALNDAHRGGLIAHLELEVLPWIEVAQVGNTTERSHDVGAVQYLQSVGACFQHPADILQIGLHTAGTRREADPEATTNVYTSISDAWKAAVTLSRAQSSGFLCDGRWRVIGASESGVQSFSGTSASGAAALGFYHALRGTFPDPELIVLAQIDDQGALSEVDNIDSKVKAIVANRNFDTIVVAGDRDAEEAIKALKKAGSTHISVFNLASSQRIFP